MPACAPHHSRHWRDWHTHVLHEPDEVRGDGRIRAPVIRHGEARNAVGQQLRQGGEGQRDDRQPAAQHVHHLRWAAAAGKERGGGEAHRHHVCPGPGFPHWVPIEFPDPSGSATGSGGHAIHLDPRFAAPHPPFEQHRGTFQAPRC